MLGTLVSFGKGEYLLVSLVRGDPSFNPGQGLVPPVYFTPFGINRDMRLRSLEFNGIISSN